MDELDDYMLRTPFAGRFKGPFARLPSGASRTPSRYDNVEYQATSERTVARPLPFTPPHNACETSDAAPATAKQPEAPASPIEEITVEQRTDTKRRTEGGKHLETPSVTRYFTLLRQAQSDSPINRNEHPQGHLIQRKFKLMVDEDQHCEISRVVESAEPQPSERSDSPQPQRPKPSEFSCSDELSNLVNIGDAALCRLIGLRTAFSSEKDVFRAFCDASSATALRLGEELRCNELAQAAEEEEDPERSTAPSPKGDGEDRMWELGKELVRRTDERAHEKIDDLLQRASSLPPGARDPLVSALEDMVHQAGVVPPAQPSTFTSQHALDEVESLLQREQEAKAHSNLAHGAQLRKEIIFTLNAALAEALKQIKELDAPRRDTLSEQRRISEHLKGIVATAKSEQQSKQSAERAIRQQREQNQKELVSLEAKSNERKQGLMSFLKSSDTEMAGVVEQIDALYGKLETIIHARSTHLRSFVQAHGQLVLERERIIRSRREQESAVRKCQRDSNIADMLLSCLETMERIHVDVARINDERLMTAAEVSSASKERLCAEGETLYSKLRSVATGWIDVLVKNDAREAERMRTLQAQIRDATERYHQEDKDLYAAQLSETMQRRSQIQGDISKFEKLLRDASEAMTAVGSTQPAMQTTPQRPISRGNAACSTTPSNLQNVPLSPEPQKALFGKLVLRKEEAEKVGHSAGDSKDDVTLVDIDTLSIEDAVPLFRKSAAITFKWVELLRNCDIESVKDLRDIRSTTSVWDCFLQEQPLLKAQLELLLDHPERFLA